MEREVVYDRALGTLRDKIRGCDRISLEEISTRFQHAFQVAILKHDTGREICDPVREEELITGMEKEFPTLPPGFVREYYELILRYSKEFMQKTYDHMDEEG
tara:strand:+ start:986 stop:1291 length:306 start_codon:yes stop_codon:yes gene_type:complete